MIALEATSTKINVPVPQAGAITHGGKKVELDKPTAFWFVSFEAPNGVWTESFATEFEKDAFLRGLKAASVALGSELDVKEQEGSICGYPHQWKGR